MLVAGLKHIDTQWLPKEEFEERTLGSLLTIKSKPGGIEEMLRLSTLCAKKLSEELLPLVAYTHFHEEADFDICWHGCNQEGYDAELRSETPELPEHVEVTMALPDNEYLVRAFHAENGYSWTAAGTRRDPVTKRVESKCVSGDMASYMRELELLVGIAVAKKLKKAYPVSTSLIVQIRLDSRVLLRSEFDDLVSALRATPVDPNKKFREVVLVEPYEYRVASL